MRLIEYLQLQFCSIFFNFLESYFFSFFSVKDFNRSFTYSIVSRVFHKNGQKICNARFSGNCTIRQISTSSTAHRKFRTAYFQERKVIAFRKKAKIQPNFAYFRHFFGDNFFRKESFSTKFLNVCVKYLIYKEVDIIFIRRTLSPQKLLY